MFALRTQEKFLKKYIYKIKKEFLKYIIDVISCHMFFRYNKLKIASVSRCNLLADLQIIGYPMVTCS